MASCALVPSPDVPKPIIGMPSFSFISVMLHSGRFPDPLPTSPFQGEGAWWACPSSVTLPAPSGGASASPPPPPPPERGRSGGGQKLQGREKTDIRSPFLSLDRAGGEAADEQPLHGEEQDGDRQRHDQRG